MKLGGSTDSTEEQGDNPKDLPVLNQETRSPRSRKAVAPRMCEPSSPSSESMLLEQALLRIKVLEEENEELKRKQVEIQTAKELYLKIFEDFPALIWRSRLDKMCDYFNRTWLEWTGNTLEQEFGNGWTKGVHADDYEKCLETYSTSFDRQEPFYMEYRLLNKDNEYRWIGDHGTPFYDLDDTFLGYIGSCYDITNVKNTEEKLVSLNATKDKFFSIVAHDLRNPIANFVSLSEILVDGCGELCAEELKDLASMMHKDSRNTLLLLENLLEWSRAQSDDVAYEPSSIDPEVLVYDAWSQVESSATAKKIDLSADIEYGSPFEGDRRMLSSVLRNLFMNSIKFSEPGGLVTVKVGFSDSKSSVVFSVADNGVGIPKDKIPELFKLGTNKTTQGTRNEQGSGLGLTMCHDFVNRHHGFMKVESETGLGTTIKVHIPSNRYGGREK